MLERIDTYVTRIVVKIRYPCPWAGIKKQRKINEHSLMAMEVEDDSRSCTQYDTYA